ncbi:hypothetical protein OC861_002096 [Tilletia horrida]|nr:hypothetical protein OC845_000063 [Tilletia horrida]KAK0568306.1 hypothetical protein OC861_002096 [Tilletia horrida]
MIFNVLALPTLALLVSAASLTPRAASYINPKTYGGSSLGYFANSTNGEPLNVIVTGIPSLANFSSWYKAIGFGKECLGLHSGGAMQAFIDSRGPFDQQGEIRFAYGENPDGEGSCFESLAGGNHFRYWQQQKTNAWFLAASHEENLFEHHTIEPNGYNIGRDEIVKSATKPSTYKGMHFNATVKYVTGLLPTGSQGINHGIAIDGKTAVLRVTVS